MAFEWHDEHITTLRQLWQKGMTAREIAARIDPSLTRNAVIGKANRLGLSAQDKISANDLFIDQVIPNDFQCQWTFGHVQEETFHFCLQPVVRGRPYCDEHCRLAYRRQGEGAD